MTKDHSVRITKTYKNAVRQTILKLETDKQTVVLNDMIFCADCCKKLGVAYDELTGVSNERD